MSNWTKGARVEDKYCKILEKEGWITRRFYKSRFGKQDVWGVDIIAKRLGETRWIQVKSRANRMPGMLHKDIEELKLLSNHCNPDSERVLWVGYRVDSKEWKVVEV